MSGIINGGSASEHISRSAIVYKQGLELEGATKELAKCCTELSELGAEVRQMIQDRRSRGNAPTPGLQEQIQRQLCAITIIREKVKQQRMVYGQIVSFGLISNQPPEYIKQIELELTMCDLTLTQVMQLVQSLLATYE